VTARRHMSTLPMDTIRCGDCDGTGLLRQYPRDTQWCPRCKGTGGTKVHPANVLGYGCNRCQTTWDKPHPPYCESCGGDATHYRLADGGGE
jgi:DnaJ-class molecular chaperone